MRSSMVIIGVAIFLLGLAYVFTLIGWWPWHQNFIVMSVFFIFLTILSHQINRSSIHQEGRAVIIPYLISTVLKLIFSGGFLFVIVKLYPEMAKVLVPAFLLYYATFSALEIILVSRRTKLEKF